MMNMRMTSTMGDNRDNFTTTEKYMGSMTFHSRIKVRSLSAVLPILSYPTPTTTAGRKKTRSV
jgi:hypothetical protein